MQSQEFFVIMKYEYKWGGIRYGIINQSKLFGRSIRA